MQTQTPKPNPVRPDTAREAAMKRRTFDMGEVLGMRHLRTMAVDEEPKLEEPKAAPTASSRP